MSLIASSQLTIVVGLGVSGLAAARYLQKNNKNFAVVDSRENPPNVDLFAQGFVGVPLKLGELDVDYLLNADEVILSPGVSLQTPAIKAVIDAGISVIGDVELFARVVTAPVIAITGSNAKTTVTTLVGEMAKASGVKVAVGGNIGRPVLDLLEDNAELYVLELSSFQLETTESLKPLVASILNISEDHMDRYDSLMDYFRAKQRIYWGAQNIVSNRDDPLTQPPIAADVNYFSFGMGRSDRNQFGFINESLSFEFSTVIEANAMQLKGRHNHLNGLAAMAIGHAAGFKQSAMIEVLKCFSGLPHRCEWVANINGVEYINDSKATNVGATLAAIEGFGRQDKKTLILIAGGEGKGAKFSPLKPAIDQYVRHVFLIGADAELFAGAIKGEADVQFATDLTQAIEQANQKAVTGDVVLLSPACASFDMFSSFEDRGECFITAVKDLAA